MLENDIPKPIMISMFQLTNVELTNVEHCTKWPTWTKKVWWNSTCHRTSSLIDFNCININQHEQMTNAYQNLQL
jgi:hypothetical protein